MMEAVCTSETSVDNHFTRQYNPEDSSEHHTRRRENLKSHNIQIPRKLMEWKPEGRRSVEQLTLQWMDGWYKGGFKKMKIRSGGQLPGKESWRKILREAEAHSGLQSS
jgi:hypothetical protein